MKVFIQQGLLQPLRSFVLPWHFSRLNSTSAGLPHVDKSLLSKLRKQTGFPFINCKKALVKFDNNIDEAKEWLIQEAQKEGWAKATKLQTRPMSQGLIAILGNNAHTTMLEVNCETDFVARNKQFIDMAVKLVQDCSAQCRKSPDFQISLNKADLELMKTSEEMSFADLVALTVGSLGENLALRRAIHLKAEEGAHVASYVHPAGTKRPDSVLLGKYGALVKLHQTGQPADPSLTLEDMNSRICQHIVGMNPKTIGEYIPEEKEEVDEPAEDSKAENVQSEEFKDENVQSGESSDEEVTGEPESDITEDQLLQQEFLLDNSVKVGELLLEYGVDVLDFRRFACGEELAGEDER